MLLRRSVWPPVWRPHIYRNGGRWVVRFINPVEKRVRVFRSRHFHVVAQFARLLQEEEERRGRRGIGHA